MTKEEKQVLMRCNNKISFDVWSGVTKSIYDLSKDDVKMLVNDYHYFAKQNNTLFKEDKDKIKAIINNWCIAYRCYSLYLQ